MDDVELQDDLQRYSTRFAAAAAQALEERIRSPQRRVSDAALEQSLRYASSACDIVGGPFPEQNLLDMVVFVCLCREPVERRLLPDLDDEGTARMADLFEQSEREIWQIADRVLDEAGKQWLVGIIDRWQDEHPNLVHVEGVRLGDLAPPPGPGAARGERARGLFRNLKSATESADRALLLANRLMYMAHRMPFLVRLQARLAAREILSDAVDRLLLGPDAVPVVILREVTALVRGGARRLRLGLQRHRA